MGEQTGKAVIRLFHGNLLEGCPVVELQIYQERKQIASRLGKLPVNIQLNDSLQSFVMQGKSRGEEYSGEENNEEESSGNDNNSERKKLPKEPLTNPDSAKDLDQQLDEWLNNKEFEVIKEFLISHARQLDTLIIESNQADIKRLPWLRWSKIKEFCPNIQIVFTS